MDLKRIRTPKYKIGESNENGWKVHGYTRNDDGRFYYELICECGCNELRKVRGDSFKEYKKLCDYQKSLIPPKHMPRELYKTRLIGEQFGNLKVIDFLGYDKYGSVLYICECQCKDKTLISATYNQLTSGRKDSCGCLTKQKMHNSHKKYNKYDLSGEYGIGWTSNTNKEFYFDLEDYDKIKDYCWFEHKMKEDDKDGYIEARSLNNGKNVKLHRVVMNIDIYDIKIDHIKHNLLDNRKSRLRIATNQENTMNHVLHSNNTTGVSGVNFDEEKGLYRVRIYYKNRTIHLGYYKTLEEAEYIRKQAEEKYFGKWSYDNSMKYEDMKYESD